MLCMRILRSALLYMNTLTLQDTLGESEWAEFLKLAAASVLDARG
ncbi:hypothetical protein ACRB68_70050 [Actinomadura sp. RB68]|uniref:Uncharacterized protein n=1 Tax=Actinomadura macrotermitis TaxID=2585200 RepID=A0A7K0C7X6_9ACTN|nr:hypothetical protein [Actinomadura macrotermitis]